MGNKGWICLHRKIQDCDIWQDPEPYDRRSAWIDLLLSANHNDNSMLFDGHRIVVERGQFLTSVRKLSERWQWSKDRTLRYLRLLEELDMIHRESNARRTLITIVNYSNYQDMRDTDKDTDKDSYKDTHKDTHKDTDTPQTTMINNDNNVNNENNNKGRFKKPTLEEVKEYCFENIINIDEQAFIDYYESVGWTVGRNKKMKDWKASVRNWERRQRERINKPQQQNLFDVLARV